MKKRPKGKNYVQVGPAFSGRTWRPQRWCPSPGRPCMSCEDENIKRVRPHMLSDCRVTVRMIGEALRLGNSWVDRIVTEYLEIKEIFTEMVPKLLTPEPKFHQKRCCIDWKTSNDGDEFLQMVVTGDKAWIYQNNIELRSQSKEWKRKHEPR